MKVDTARPTPSAVFSRRSVLRMFRAVPATVLTHRPQCTDSDLLRAGQEFDRIAAWIDCCHSHRIAWVEDTGSWMMTTLCGIEDLPAATLEGLYVKARAAYWLLDGELEADKCLLMSDRIALSIVRNLIDLHFEPAGKTGVRMGWKREK